MLFSQSIPDSVLENQSTAKFVSVLDSLQEYKQEIITDAIRSFNPVLCTNEKWLRKSLTDYGFSDIPKGFPIKVMQQMLLNADSIMRLRGSRLGLEFFLSTCSLGVPTIDDTEFTKHVDCILLDSLSYGYPTSNSEDKHFLCGDSELTEKSHLSISLQSKYFDGNHKIEKDAIIGYLQTVIYNYVGFASDLIVEWSFNSRSDFYYHDLLNKQYIN